ncbi:MAG TPA: M48 family metallopeptidase [Gemmatimonadaceae bacterium]|nr:M48 family metallopeptidase [Gemmatimonadaceae bacterium]
MMPNMMIPIRLFSVAALALLAACDVSDDDERALGADYSRQINEQVPLVTDSRVTGYVSALGRQIAQRTSRGGLEWQFFVVNSHDVNAFALPGGFIYVNRGLIERSSTLDHLAGVLGHEIGHVVERHSVEQMKKATGTNIGLTVLCSVTSICEGALGQVAVNMAGSALLAKYSRADEAEADSQAVVNVISAGISPRGIPEFFRVLMSERKRDPNLLDNFFASHPLEESRVQRTQELIEALGDSRVNGLPRDDQGFQRFKAIVSALPAPPQTARPNALP